MKITLIILGLLSEKNLYGYEIKKIIKDRCGDFINIQFGSIYFAIKKAEKKEWVKKASVEKNGTDPERCVYQLLPAGKKYFQKGLRDYFNKNLMHFESDIVLMFADSLEASQKEVFIEDRKEFLTNKLNELQETIGSKKKSVKPLSLFNYIENHLKTELAWIKSIK
jgi:PadR family transcriptional regulator, regulatory protein PadR